MQAIDDYVGRVAEHFKSKLGSALLEAYKIGSLAHGGFSPIYSDLDVGLILSCSSPPADMDRMIAEAKGLDDEYGKNSLSFGATPIATGGVCRHWIGRIFWTMECRY